MENIFRIKKYNKGFVVEIQKRKWFGKKYWHSCALTTKSL